PAEPDLLLGHFEEGSRRVASAAEHVPRGEPEPIDSELEIVDGHALVRRVHEARDQLDVHGTSGEEAVRDGAERLAEPVAVREAGDAHRNWTRARLRVLDEGLHGVPERRLERRARTAVRLEHLELVVAVAENLAHDRLLLLGRLTREQTAVDRDVADRRNDVA